MAVRPVATNIQESQVKVNFRPECLFLDRMAAWGHNKSTGVFVYRPSFMANHYRGILRLRGLLSMRPVGVV